MQAVAPIRAQALGGCALESSFHGGVKRERLRGLCQVQNTTSLPLQVALATVQSSADEWQMVPQRAAQPARGRTTSQVGADGPARLLSCLTA